ncbi:MAG: DMT family transporter [Xanthomonadales bacterium]|nr:DMT family transporter [Xanthomonadales bacterium]
MPAGHPQRMTLLATMALLAVTAVWGSTFVMIKDLLARMSVVDFLAVRYAIGAVAALVLFAGPVRRLGRAQLARGLLLGVLYGLGQLLQTWGLALIAPSVSGFVTGTYVIFTPILATILLRQRMAPMVWAAVAMATLGLGLLTLRGFAVGTGVWLTLAAAMLYALQIIGLSRWSRPGDTLGLSAVQMLAIAVVCGAATLPHGPALPPDPGAWLAVLYMALVAGVLAMILQTWAQAHLSATRSAIMMTGEPLFAAAFAVAFGSDLLTWRMLLGGGLIVAAMALVEWKPGRQPAPAPLGPEP